MLSWQTLTIVTAPSSSFKRYRLSGARSLASYRILRTKATLKKYIPVSEAELLDAIVSRLFKDARQFRLLSSCLDSILHAEHKRILEQMRTDYYFSRSTERKRKKTSDSESEVVANGERSKLTGDSIEPETWFNYGLDLRNFLNSSAKNVRKYSDDKSRRGYATERQQGLLIVEKMDYLQSRLLRGIFSIISKPLGKVGKWITYNFNEEPAFQELILLYAKDFAEGDIEDNSDAQAFQLKIYERIPIPDLPVIFPHKKLYFRIIDTVRLDAATILGLSAFFINYKFEDILSSPSAIFLDVVAVTALIIYVSRVALGYKQTWDRYQLLVNKTLYEKTLASGFGSIHFLLDASEQQQYKEAILTYAILLNMEKGQVEMPVDKVLNTLVRLGIVTETSVDGRLKLQAIPCPKAYEAIRDRWYGLFG
ncbi:hypothetical protein CRYUN_Cryun01aG0206300 [Craigia yunnanensis]